jgi:nitric oxide dioxygenase
MHDTMKEGDTLRVSHPAGDFFLSPSQAPDTPLVLISGGIGLTPLMSILNSLVTKQCTRPISWIHGARCKNVRAFGEHIQKVKASNENVQVTLFNDQPGADEVEGKDYDYAGFVDLEKLDKQKVLFLDNEKTQYWCVGPVPFMVGMERALAAKGVPSSRIHVERFGTGGVPAA